MSTMTLAAALVGWLMFNAGFVAGAVWRSLFDPQETTENEFESDRWAEIVRLASDPPEADQ